MIGNALDLLLLQEPGLVTQKQVARLARTSLKTVSRVINRDPLVKPQTRERIEQIIAELGYQPSQAARMMRSSKSDIIGFLADSVATTTSSVDLVRGAQDVAWERGKQMMLFNVERGTPSAGLAEAQLSAFRAEAVIYAAPYHQEVDVGPVRLPHVLLNCFDALGRYPAVVPDDYQMGLEVTRQIFARGYKRPIFLNLSANGVASGLRGAGFVAAAAEQGLDLRQSIQTAVSTPVGSPRPKYTAKAILTQCMQGPDRPDVILCGQDAMAMTVYFLLGDMGLRVGEDVAVTSFDDQRPIVDLLQPGLSTMALPYYEMGRVAMNAAIDGAPAETLRLPGAFISRQSL